MSFKCLARASLSARKNRILSRLRNRIPLSMPGTGNRQKLKSRTGDRSSSHMLSGSPSSESGLAGIQIQPGLYHIPRSYRTRNHLRWWRPLKGSELPQFICTAYLFSPLNHGEQEKLFSFYKNPTIMYEKQRSPEPAGPSYSKASQGPGSALQTGQRSKTLFQV